MEKDLHKANDPYSRSKVINVDHRYILPNLFRSNLKEVFLKLPTTCKFILRGPQIISREIPSVRVCVLRFCKGLNGGHDGFGYRDVFISC